MINRIENSELEMLPNFWHVMLAYYKGRFSLYNNDFNTAHTELSLAFKNCHKGHFSNKQMILRFLVPIRMTKGHCPTPKLIEAYQLFEYKELVEACLKGDMVALEKAIEEHIDNYIRTGVFIVIEKIKMVTMRNFIKRMYSAISQTPELQF